MLIAKPTLLTSKHVPKGVKRYFCDYAAERELFGQKVLVLSQLRSWTWQDALAYKDRKGVGPGHSVELMKYEKDMPKKEDRRAGVKPGTFHPVSVNTWLYEYMREGGALVVQLHEAEERHVCSAGCD